MGENPQRVYTAGAIGVENALHTNFMSKQELEKSLECSLGEKIAVLTFHPVTLEHNTAEIQIGELIKAIKHYPEITFICTKANADMSGRIINDSLQKCAETQKNIILFDSLGLKRYLSLLSYAEFVIGNSSSGIIEVPSFKIPTINIGDRQKGRTQARSVINCIPKADNIIEAISTALSEEFKNSICNIVNPYGDGNASEVIVNVTKEFLLNNKLKIQKSFYDIT